MGLLNTFENIETIPIGQSHIGQAQTVTPRLQTLKGIAHSAHGFTGQAHAQQGQFKQFPNVGLVIDHQHVGHQGLALIHGQLLPLSTKCAPSSARARSRLAPLASASSRAIYKPSPVPLGSVVAKGSKTFSYMSGSIPGPSSTTCNATRDPGKSEVNKRIEPIPPEQ